MKWFGLQFNLFEISAGQNMPCILLFLVLGESLNSIQRLITSYKLTHSLDANYTTENRQDHT